MKQETNKLKSVWLETQKTALENTIIPSLNFAEIINNLVSVGPFYFYVVDFFDMSLSHVSDSITAIHGFEPDTVTFDDIIGTIHPDDMEFVAQAEKSIFDFLYHKIGPENVLNYKHNYSFRSKMSDGSYRMLNHQALVLTTDNEGGFGKSLNIHTDINHITKINPYTFSLIGLGEFPSYLDIKINHENSNQYSSFSPREFEIIKLIYSGCSTKEIADVLHLSFHTIKTHRKNILRKSNCRNLSELIHMCVASGMI